METILSADEIEARAAAAGLSMRQLCKRAAVAASTFRRWKMQENSPSLDVVRRLQSALPEAADQIGSDAGGQRPA